MANALQVGDLIGDRFEIVEVHEGGMGRVYVSREPAGPHPRRLVALKTLREEFLLDRARCRRFEAECHIWVRLGGHPNIVRAYSTEVLGGLPYVLIEYVDGGELRRWIGRPELDLRRALRFGVQFCLGMEQAQRVGLFCHRDIKPANLLIARDGTLKITDFGLVRLRDEILGTRVELPGRAIPLEESGPAQAIRWTDPRDYAGQAGTQAGTTAEVPREAPAEPSTTEHATDAGAEAEATLDREATAEYRVEWGEAAPTGSLSVPRVTRTGLLLGTLPYMAPEQFQSAADADIRADIYSFGVVLFEMLTSVRPFQGRTQAMLRRQHERYAPPSVTTAIPRRFRQVARRVDDIVQRCLRKDPEDRYPTIPVLRRDLTRALHAVDPGFRPGVA